MVKMQNICEKGAKGALHEKTLSEEAASARKVKYY